MVKVKVSRVIRGQMIEIQLLVGSKVYSLGFREGTSDEEIQDTIRQHLPRLANKAFKIKDVQLKEEENCLLED